MEDENLENLKAYRAVGYVVVILTVLGIFGMGFAWLHYHNTKVDILHLEFPYIGDLRFDDPFTLNGYQVGMVKGIEVIGPDRVILEIHLRIPIEIHEGFNLFIGDLGIMGERLVCLENGPQEAPIVNPRDTLTGEFFPGVSEMLGRITELRDFLDSAMVFVNRLHLGSDTAKSIIEWVSDTKNTLDRFLGSLENFSFDIDKDLPKFLEQINDLTVTLNSELEKFEEKLPDILNKTDVIIGEADTLLEQISKIKRIGDDAQNLVDGFDLLDMQSINQSLTNIQSELIFIVRQAHNVRLFLRGWR